MTRQLLMWLCRLLCFHRSLLRRRHTALPDAPWWWHCPRCLTFVKPVLQDVPPAERRPRTPDDS